MRRNQKDTEESARRISRRALLLGGAQAAFVAVLGLRMRYMQVDQADQFRLLAEENRINIRLIPPARDLTIGGHIAFEGKDVLAMSPADLSAYRGGGVALIRALQAIAGLKGANEDQNHGINIAKRAMEAPLREIVANCGEESSVVLNNVAEGKGNYGYNAATGEYGDMIAFGILDPTKVTRSALQNAASIAGLMITTEAMVAEAPKKDESAGGGMGGGGMGGMGGMDF